MGEDRMKPHIVAQPTRTKKDLCEARIGVLMGGLSAEREVSFKSGRAVLAALKRLGYQALEVDVNDSFMTRLSSLQLDAAFVVLHGRGGEDGVVQGTLELAGIPYTGSGVLSSALGIDKVMTKILLDAASLPTPSWVAVNSRTENPIELVLDNIALPAVVKPSREGSTIGLSLVFKKEDLADALANAHHYDQEVVVESFIDGSEITVGVLGNSPPETLPIIEIKPKGGHYDFEAKYTKGMTEFIIPACVTPPTAALASDLAAEVFSIIKCRGMARVDMIVDRKDQVWILEINTIPGMTETSLLPMAAAYVGITFDKLVDRILKEAWHREM